MQSLQILTLAAVLVIQVFGVDVYRRQTNFGRTNYNNDRDFQRTPQRSAGGGGSCPEKDGRYPTGTCDGYIECKDGVPEEKLCPDGLLFNPATGPQAFPCQYPLDVDCTGREQTQPAQATDECPHQYGYYLMGDATNCGKFKNCVAGRGFIFDCPEGLAFNGESYRCDWPDQVPSCDAEGFLGFNCPPDARAFGLGQEEFRFFRSPNDCQRYFVCVSNRPRLYNCGEGRAFNDLINTCDGVENVTGCAGPQYSTSNEFGRSSGEIKRNSFRNYRI